MKSAWNRIFENQRRMQKQYEKLLPSMNYLDSIKKNYVLWNRIAKPNQELVKHFERFNKLIDSPVISQIEKLTTSLNNILPDYSESFLLSSSVLVLYKNSAYKIPDYLQEFTLANESLINSTNTFSLELDALINTEFDLPSIYDSLPELLIFPIISGSAHFKTLKYLGFYDIEISEESEKEYTEIITYNSFSAEKKIENTNRDWSVLLAGAEISLLSRNPDKVRHTITSLRELMTQILHHFAPDKEIRKEYLDDKYYHDGRPTRRTRIEYILKKKYGNASLINIIEKDLDACLELFNLYQEGTHSIVSTLCDEELLFILKRTKLLIEQLI